MLYAGVRSDPVLASTIVVPDDIPTVQLAIDSGADTVAIRPGNYAERPVVDHPIVLMGIATGQRPRLVGLDIVNTYFWAQPPLLGVSQLSFSKRVLYTTITYRPRTLWLSFESCSLDAGIELRTLDVEDISSLSISNSRLGGESMGAPSSVTMEADTVDGGVSWRTYSGDGVSIRSCWFRGGNLAVHLFGGPRGTVGANRFERYLTALRIDDAEGLMVESNEILECRGTAIDLGWGSQATVRRNYLRASEIGIKAMVLNLDLDGNTVLGARNQGIWSQESIHLTIDHNFVGYCGGAGVQVDRPGYEASVSNNTIYGNAGSGMVLDARTQVPFRVENDIAANNGGWGLMVEPAGMVTLGCNDWCGNGVGAVSGVAPDSTDLSVDPLFCDVDSADVRLDSSSPLVDVPGCGQIGALGVGCGVTATVVQGFVAGRVTDGIRVVWEIAEGARATEVWLERSEAMEGKPWSRPLTERSIESRAVVELDRGAALDRAYWYRLVALEGGEAAVIGAPIMVEGQARREFRLVEVGPNPGGGPVRIAFALEHAAAIEVDVFDVQGRRVASPGRGLWPAGSYELVWDGRMPNGQAAPAGMYVIRYLYPGGQDRRGIVRIR